MLDHDTGRLVWAAEGRRARRHEQRTHTRLESILRERGPGAIAEKLWMSPLDGPIPLGPPAGTDVYGRAMVGGHRREAGLQPPWQSTTVVMRSTRHRLDVPR